MSLTAYIWGPAEPGPVWLVPGLLPSVPARSGGSSEAAPGAWWCFGGCHQQLSVPVPEPSPGFPRPCLGQAAGHRRVLVEAEVSCAGKRPPGWAKGLGELEGVLREGPGHSFLPSPPLAGTVSDQGLPSFCSVCDASEGDQLLILISSPKPAAAHEHGHGDRADLPHLP